MNDAVARRQVRQDLARARAALERVGGESEVVFGASMDSRIGSVSSSGQLSGWRSRGRTDRPLRDDQTYTAQPVGSQGEMSSIEQRLWANSRKHRMMNFGRIIRVGGTRSTGT